MKKYRIVKTEGGDYKIQKSILFGLFWTFAKEPIASYSEYRHGYEFDENELFSYNLISEARNAISFMKRKKRVIYRGYVIRLMKTNSYDLLRNYEYRYFVKPRSAESYPASFSYTSFEDAKSYVDEKHKDVEEYNKRYKVKEIVTDFGFGEECNWELDSTWIEKQCEQKIALGEYDLAMIDNLVTDENCPLDSEYISWLKSLKDRFQLQPKKNWSEDDEKLLNSAISLVYEVGDISLHSWLESIKDRIQQQPKKEWSKEDSERLLRIHQFIWANRKGDTDEIYQQEQDADWIMSLNPQQNNYDKGYNDGYSAAKYNQWKPTDKQMEDFRMLLDYNIGVFDYAKFMSVNSLYDDLKKNLID